MLRLSNNHGVRSFQKFYIPFKKILATLLHLTVFKPSVKHQSHRIYTIWKIENASMFQQINGQRLKKVISFILQDTL